MKTECRIEVCSGFGESIVQNTCTDMTFKNFKNEVVAQVFFVVSHFHSRENNVFQFLKSRKGIDFEELVQSDGHFCIVIDPIKYRLNSFSFQSKK